MSMIARFVQVQPSLRQDLLEDPSSVESMFEDQPVEGSGVQTAEVAERMRKLFATRGAAMVAGGLPGLDPKMREALNQRLEQLGVNMEALKAGQGGEALADLLMSRMGMMRKGTGAGAGRAPKVRGAAISLDKAWHGVHYLLCGSAVPDSTALGQAVMRRYGNRRRFQRLRRSRLLRRRPRRGYRARTRPRHARSRDAGALRPRPDGECGNISRRMG